MWLLMPSPGQKRCIKDVSNLSGGLGSPAQEGERPGESESLQAQGVAWLLCPPGPRLWLQQGPAPVLLNTEPVKHAVASPGGGC